MDSRPEGKCRSRLFFTDTERTIKGFVSLTFLRKWTWLHKYSRFRFAVCKQLGISPQVDQNGHNYQGDFAVCKRLFVLRQVNQYGHNYHVWSYHGDFAKFVSQWRKEKDKAGFLSLVCASHVDCFKRNSWGRPETRLGLRDLKKKKKKKKVVAKKQMKSDEGGTS